MKAHTDIIARMESVRLEGIYDTNEYCAVEAVARHGGSATFEQMARTGQLNLTSASAVLLNLAGFRMLHRFDPRPFVTLENVNIASLKTFNLPLDSVVKFTARGWQVARLMGHGRPALIVPQSQIFTPEIAEPDAEAHRERLQLQHPLTVWSIEPEVPFHEA